MSRFDLPELCTNPDCDRPQDVAGLGYCWGCMHGYPPERTYDIVSVEEEMILEKKEYWKYAEELYEEEIRVKKGETVNA